MKKNHTRVITLMLATILMFSGITAHAVSGGTMIVDPDLTADSFNELSVVAAIHEYFAQRKAFLQGQANEITNALPGITEDEAKHAEKLASTGVIWMDSVASIVITSCTDTVAEVEATETVTYSVNGTLLTEVVDHEFIVCDNGEAIVVCTDGYKTNFSSFISASFVRDDEIALHAVDVGGSSCICYTAQNEVGYTAPSNQNTKYGAYTNNNYNDWCISFIVWCAGQSNISTSIIPMTASTSYLYDYLYNNATMYESAVQGGSATPRVGDIFFLSNNGSTSGLHHGGIVVGVTSNSIYVVDGNWSNSVQYRTISRTATNLFSFGRPNYLGNAHYAYHYSQNYHWQECGACGYSTAQVAHTFVQTSTGGSYVCTVCGYTTTSPGAVISSVEEVMLEE